MTRRTAGIFAGLALVLCTINVLVYQKERVLASGRQVFLPLGPRDPRSLMQGDYMELRYDLPSYEGWAKDGLLRVSLDARGVGTIIAPAAPGQTARPGEILLRYRVRGMQLRLGAEAFYFQEGTSSLYDSARFGELRVAPSGESVLVGLRDEQLRSLGHNSRRVGAGSSFTERMLSSNERPQ